MHSDISQPPSGTQDGHFVNLPVKDVSYKATQSDIDAVCANRCVTVEIQKYLAVLAAVRPGDAGEKRLAEQQALSFVVHFIGDIHQPLHKAERDDDQGGNDERVSFCGTDVSGKNYPLKLHTIWDNQVVAKIKPTDTDLVKVLKPEIAQAAGEPATSPSEWTIESFQYAEDSAYKGMPAADGSKDVATLGKDYQKLATPIVRLQIARAGVKLAGDLQANLH